MDVSRFVARIIVIIIITSIIPAEGRAGGVAREVGTKTKTLAHDMASPNIRRGFFCWMQNRKKRDKGRAYGFFEA